MIENSRESAASAQGAHGADSASFFDGSSDEIDSKRERRELPGVAQDAGDFLSALRVVVQEKRRGAPLAQVRVILQGTGQTFESTTDLSGRVLFESLPAGCWDVRALGEGYADGRARVELPLEDGEREIPVFLEPGAVLEGKIVGISTQRPIAGVRLRYHDPVTGIDRSTHSSEGGRFSFSGLPARRTPERNNLRWGKNSFYSFNNGPEIVFVPRGQDRFETILHLEPGLPVSGHVLDGRGVGAANVPVFAYHAESQATKSFRFYQDFGKRVLIDGMVVFEECSTRTDSEGFFRIGAVPPGFALTIAAIVPGHSRVESTPVVLESGDALSGIVLRASAGASVTGTVTDETNSPIKDALVDLYGRQKKRPFSLSGSSAARPNCLSVQKTDRAGAFAFEGLDAGEFRLRAYKQGYGNILSQWITLKKGASANKAFVLERGALCASGRIADLDGRPVQGIIVEFTPWPLPQGKSITPFHTRSTEEGFFRVAGLWDGARHMVNARDPDRRYTVERIDTLPKMVLPGTDGIEFRAYRAAAVTGRIEDIPHGAIPRVRVVRGDGNDRQASRICQVDHGFFSIKNLLPGVHYVEVSGQSPPESLPEKIVGQFCVDEGEHLEGLVFFYGKTLELRGIVLAEPNRSPQKDIRVTLIDRALRAAPGAQNPRAGLLSETITDEAGRFHFRGLVQGRYDLIAWDLLFGSARLCGLDLLEGDEATDLELVLTPGVRVSGNACIGDLGEPARSVQLRIMNDDQTVRTLMTDREGNFEASLIPGTYRCALEFPSGQIGVSTLVVPTEGLSGLVLRF